MSLSSTPTLRQRSIEMARSVLALNPVFLDTETTGLGADDEIIEISIIDTDGSSLVDTLVRPQKTIPPDSTAIHGITNAEVQTARPWHVVWSEVRAAMFGRMTVIYNQEFDLRMIQQSHARSKIPSRDRFNTFDLLKLYAEFHGEWDPRRKAYRYVSLDAAGKQCGIELPNAHRARADTLLTRALLFYLAGLEK